MAPPPPPPSARRPASACARCSPAATTPSATSAASRRSLPVRAKLRRRPLARVRLCEDGVYKMHAKQGPRTLVFEPTASDECSLDAIDYM